MVLGLFYVAKIFLVTVFTSILIAFMLKPIVDGLTRLRIPRAVSSLIAVTLMLAALATAVYFFYNRAVEFGHELPKYSQRIQGMGTLKIICDHVEALQPFGAWLGD